jgi:hypothetical protein
MNDVDTIGIFFVSATLLNRPARMPCGNSHVEVEHMVIWADVNIYHDSDLIYGAEVLRGNTFDKFEPFKF